MKASRPVLLYTMTLILILYETTYKHDDGVLKKQHVDHCRQVCDSVKAQRVNDDRVEIQMEAAFA